MNGLEPGAWRFIEHALRGYLGMVERPEDFASILEVIRGADTPEMLAAHGRFMMREADTAALARERYATPNYDLEEMRTHPPGSLAREYAEMMLRRGFLPREVARKVGFDRPPRDDAEYLIDRRLKTHDVHHLITGFDTSVAGEMGISTLYFVQMRNPAPPLLLAATLSHCVLEPEWLDPLARAVAHGWKLGHVMKPLMPARWEEGWDRSLQSWREEFRVEPAPPETSSRHLEQHTAAL